MTKKLPPYSKAIPTEQNCIVVCTGSGAWQQAKSTSWIHSLSKTLLPLNDDVNFYRWDFVCGKDVMLFCHGNMEPYDRLIELTRELLNYGANFVLWMISEFPMNKFTGEVLA